MLLLSLGVVYCSLCIAVWCFFVLVFCSQHFVPPLLVLSAASTCPFIGAYVCAIVWLACRRLLLFDRPRLANWPVFLFSTFLYWHCWITSCICFQHVTVVTELIFSFLTLPITSVHFSIVNLLWGQCTRGTALADKCWACLLQIFCYAATSLWTSFRQVVHRILTRLNT